MPTSSSYVTPSLDPIFVLCDNHGVRPNTSGEIETRIWDRHWVKLLDSSSGIGAAITRFVLFAPDTTNEVIRSTITARKRACLPSGFAVQDALEYDEVLLIGAISDQDRAEMTHLRINVIDVGGDTPDQIRDALSAHLGQSEAA